MIRLALRQSERNCRSPNTRDGLPENAKTAAALPGKIGIGHTRWATHGIPNEVNAHPHTDCSNRIAIVHNGIIENYAELKRQLLSRGTRFVRRPIRRLSST